MPQHLDTRASVGACTKEYLIHMWLCRSLRGVPGDFLGTRPLTGILDGMPDDRDVSVRLAIIAKSVDPVEQDPAIISSGYCMHDDRLKTPHCLAVTIAGVRTVLCQPRPSTSYNPYRDLAGLKRLNASGGHCEELRGITVCGQ